MRFAQLLYAYVLMKLAVRGYASASAYAKRREAALALARARYLRAESILDAA